MTFMVRCYYDPPPPPPPPPEWFKDMRQNEMKFITEKQFYEAMEKFIDGCSNDYFDFDFDPDDAPFVSDRSAAKYYLTRFAETVFPKFEQEKKRIAELEKELAMLKSRIA